MPPDTITVSDTRCAFDQGQLDNTITYENYDALCENETCLHIQRVAIGQVVVYVVMDSPCHKAVAQQCGKLESPYLWLIAKRDINSRLTNGIYVSARLISRKPHLLNFREQASGQLIHEIDLVNRPLYVCPIYSKQGKVNYDYSIVEVVKRPEKVPQLASVEIQLFSWKNNPSIGTPRKPIWMQITIPAQADNKGGIIMTIQPEVIIAAANFLFDIGRWAAKELGELWKFERESGEGQTGPVVISAEDPQAQQHLTALLEDLQNAGQIYTMKQVAEVIERNHTLIKEWIGMKADYEEEYNRQRIDRAALRLRQEELNQKIKNAMSEIERSLTSVGIQVKKDSV